MVSNFMDQFIDAAFGNQSYKFLDDILDVESVTVERLSLLKRYKEFCLPVVLESATHKSYTNNSALYIPPGYYTYPILMVLLERRITRDFLIEHIYDIFDVMSDILSEPQMRDLKFECNKYVMYETIKRL